MQIPPPRPLSEQRNTSALTDVGVPAHTTELYSGRHRTSESAAHGMLRATAVRAAILLTAAPLMVAAVFVFGEAAMWALLVIGLGAVPVCAAAWLAVAIWRAHRTPIRPPRGDGTPVFTIDGEKG
jgi:protein-S-isoprenylcysteine O-methyltransferase Ste14